MWFTTGAHKEIWILKHHSKALNLLSIMKSVILFYILLSATAVLCIRNTPADVQCGSAAMVIADTPSDQFIGTFAYSTFVSVAFDAFDTAVRSAVALQDIVLDNPTDLGTEVAYTAFEASIATCASAAATWFSVTTSAWRVYHGEACAGWRKANPSALGA